MKNAIILLFFGYFAVIHADDEVVAQGNLEVLLEALSAKSSVDHPQKGNVADLWCQAWWGEKKQLVPIETAHFERESDGAVLPATLLNGTRAVLKLGSVPVTAAGRYRCNITSNAASRPVWGWLFVKMRPVFHTNFSSGYETVENEKFQVKGPGVRATEGERALLNCPAVGYPLPDVTWYKDGKEVEPTEYVKINDRELEIVKVRPEDEGVYRCVATNEFSSKLDDEKTTWEATLEQSLRVKSSYGWIYPLIIIIIILVLLLIIIYACAAFNRYQSYNVEKRERRQNRNNNIAVNPEDEYQQQPILGYDKREANE